MGIRLVGGEYSWGVRFGELGYIIFFVELILNKIMSVLVCLSCFGIINVICLEWVLINCAIVP